MAGKLHQQITQFILCQFFTNKCKQDWLSHKNLKLATWNLCLGLSNKKDIVSQTILSNEIDICVLQEVDIPAGYDSDLLSFGSYTP